MEKKKPVTRNQSTETRNKKMRFRKKIPVKIAIPVIMMSLFIFSGTSCAGQPDDAVSSKKLDMQEPMAPTTNNNLVYLKCADVKVSGFDEAADWAPRPDAMAVIDGDMMTRWSSGYRDGEWIAFDFGSEKTVSKVVVKWESAYPTKFELMSSNDGAGWNRIVLLEGQAGGTSEIIFPPVKCRYVKLIGLERVNPDWGISIWEFEPYGPAGKNPGDLPIGEVFKPSGDKTEMVKRKESIKFSDGDVVQSPGPVTASEFQRGVNYTSWNADELDTDMSDYGLIYLSQLGVGHIALMAVYYQDDAASTRIYPDDNKTVSDKSLTHAINMIHALGMKVMLKPHVDLVDEEARTNIIASEAWFESYADFILHYAALAEKYHAELFCIGTELANTSFGKWKDEWVDVISRVRGVYKGPITYAANWDEYETVSFWDKLDYVGLDAYFPLTDKDNPPLGELVSAWDRHADTLEQWLKENNINKPVIFTEIGYDTIIGSNKQPWRVLPTLSTYVESQEEQKNCLESLFIVLSKRPWFKGFYWWNYFPRPDIGPLGYTLRGKLGEKTLAEWYEKLKQKHDKP